MFAPLLDKTGKFTKDSELAESSLLGTADRKSIAALAIRNVTVPDSPCPLPTNFRLQNPQLSACSPEILLFLPKVTFLAARAATDYLSAAPIKDNSVNSLSPENFPVCPTIICRYVAVLTVLSGV